MGLENSRRFRALPVYASLYTLGRRGYTDILSNQIRVAREIAAFVDCHEGYELLPKNRDGSSSLARVWVIVLFRSTDTTLNDRLVNLINGSQKLYVSGTQWEHRNAVRIAVANFEVDVNRDCSIAKEVLDTIWQTRTRTTQSYD
jgi:glutamate/tyrosine decarboxylase-like PLP-dependent enzyme